MHNNVLPNELSAVHCLSRVQGLGHDLEYAWTMVGALKLSPFPVGLTSCRSPAARVSHDPPSARGARARPGAVWCSGMLGDSVVWPGEKGNRSVRGHG
jgi:hypothetical protein